MKKFILILMAVLSMNVCSFAEGNNENNVTSTNKYEFRINHRRLFCVLDLSKDQMEVSEDVMTEFESDMMFASEMPTDEGKTNIARNAVKKNVKYMRYVLNDKQYRKYLMLMNVTLNNRGFNIAEISDNSVSENKGWYY